MCFIVGFSFIAELVYINDFSCKPNFQYLCKEETALVVADSWVLLRLVRLSKVSVVFCSSRVHSKPSVPNILRIESTALLPYLAA